MNTVTIARIQAKAVLPVVLAAPFVEGVMAEQATAAVADVGQFTDQARTIPAAARIGTEADQTRTYAAQATEWTRAMAKRFRELAKQEALGTIGAGEQQELERLTQDRRHLEYPRSPDEVLWEIDQRQVTANLVQALKKYVEFHQGAHPTRTPAR
jgi:nitrate reductase cytochrome c-type subunit